MKKARSRALSRGVEPIFGSSVEHLVEMKKARSRALSHFVTSNIVTLKSRVEMKKTRSRALSLILELKIV